MTRSGNSSAFSAHVQGPYCCPRWVVIAACCKDMFLILVIICYMHVCHPQYCYRTHVGTWKESFCCDSCFRISCCDQANRSSRENDLRDT